MHVKKFGAVLLALCLVLVLLPVGVMAEEAPTSGSCGDNVTWELKNGVLTISGTGPMGEDQFGYDISPWYNIRSSIKSVIIEKGVTTVPLHAFHGCSALTTVSLPDGLISIGPSAFYGCYSLSSIKLPESLNLISERAFVGCDSLQSISIPENVGTIGSSAFSSCNSLSRANLPKKLTVIEDRIFSGCSLTDITIPEGIESIGEDAFSGCELTSIIIPDGVNTIGPGAFSHNKFSGNIVLPEKITVIEEYVFRGNDRLTSFTIPKNVTTIRRNAFSECSRLSSVTIPVSVTSIELSAFQYCDKLSKVYYAGTEAQWKAITIGLNNEALQNAEVIYGSTGPDDPNNPVTPEDPTTPDKPSTPETPTIPDEPGTPVDSTIVSGKFTVALPGLDKKDYTLAIKDYTVGEDVSPVEVKNFQEFLADKGTVEGVYDIHLETADGDPYAGGMVTITLQMRLDPNRNYTVYHQGENRALSTQRNRSNTALRFRTNRFSLYAVVSTPKPATSTPSRSSGGSSMVGFTSYVIKATAGAGGSISSPGETRYDAGTNVTYTITPNAGYAVDKVIVDGKNEVSLTNGTYTFRLLNQPYTIEATFKPVSGGAAQPSAPAAAAPNPATGDSWFTHLFF